MRDYTKDNPENEEISYFQAMAKYSTATHTEGSEAERKKKTTGLERST
jgi:hypothetical protein